MVTEQVRRLVELQLHNLVTDPPPFGPGEVDLIVCRNVTIYFDRATTGALVGSFHDVLAEGGYLLLGHSETLWQVSDAFSLVPVGDAFVYRRSHDARRGAPRDAGRPRAPARPAPAVAGRSRVAAVRPPPTWRPGPAGAADHGGTDCWRTGAAAAPRRGRLPRGRPRPRRPRSQADPLLGTGVRRARPGPVHPGPGRRRGRPAAQGRLPRPRGR